MIYNIAVTIAYCAGSASGFAFARGNNGVGTAMPIGAALVCAILYAYR